MTLIFLAAASTALAAPPDHKQLTTGNDCTIFRAPAEADGTTPVLAECAWPDVDPAKLHAALADWEGHAKLHKTVVSSKVERTEGDRSLVYQEHQLSGVSNREVRIWMERRAVEGGFEYRWKSDAPVEPRKGNVATARHEGFWRVVTRPDGGALVTYRLAYDPGGSVPGFLIRWFQGSGTIETTEELRAAGR